MGRSAHTITIVGKTVEEQAQLLAALNEGIKGRDDLIILGWEKLVPGLKEGIQVDKVSGFIFQGILVAVVIFSILNTFLMSVLERTHEFGIIMSLGLTPGRLGRLVILETTLMGIAGLALGALVGGVYASGELQKMLEEKPAASS